MKSYIGQARQLVATAIGALAFSLSGPVLAQPEPSVPGLQADHQQVIATKNGPMEFAGHVVQLEAFSGITGHATDAAYIVTISGRASINGVSAKPGQIILIPPYGQTPTVQRFDAKRLAERMQQHPAMTAPMIEQLSKIASRQRTGIFFGRLGRTNFNVATSGNKAREVARRSIMGGDVARELRFESVENQEDFDRKVIERFLAALAAGDQSTVAELMDPVPFGAAISAEAAVARQTMARALLRQRDWRALLGGELRLSALSGEQWTTTVRGGSLQISLRNAQGFTFIKSVRVQGV